MHVADIESCVGEPEPQSAWGGVCAAWVEDVFVSANKVLMESALYLCNRSNARPLSLTIPSPTLTQLAGRSQPAEIIPAI